jgi:hypothetical protein
LLLQAGNAQLKGEPCYSEEDDEDEGDCKHYGTIRWCFFVESSRIPLAK